MVEFIAHDPNWLPIPGVAAEKFEVQGEPQVVDEDDNFSKATVESFFPKQGCGEVITDRGEKIPFDLKLVQLVGLRASREHIREGMRVGFDIGYTSKGPLICTLKIY